MKLPNYEINASSGDLTYEFVSEGYKGSILKRVQYTQTDQPEVYNLGFGDVDQLTGIVNDGVVSNNGDMEMVLATVVRTLLEFTERFPDRYVWAQGSSEARTRLYQMGISRYWHEIEPLFFVWGYNGVEFEKFRKGVNYQGFMAMRKPQR